MKPMGSILNANNEIFKRIAKIKQATINDPEIKKFIEQHNVTDQMIDNDLSILQEYKDSSKMCEDCESYGKCKNFVPGHTPELYIENEHIKIKHLPCPSKLSHDAEQRMKQFITAIHMPKDVLNAKLSDIYLDDKTRIDIVRHAGLICRNIAKGSETKGMYIYGPFGTGKSFILGAIANQLKEQEVYSTLLYFPEFIRELKNGFNDGTYAERLNKVKNAQVLMLDDVGAEDLTPWVRDEVLGPILNHRMMHNMPTFFSSNFDYKELSHHLSITKQGSELTKARRIMERIETLSDDYMLGGKNYRRQK
ncbi:primosomal protein DnaI [Macrococcoides caseolyticum]|uniref:primosomal protein DnaI n=1 Tax=Macrococcoides caseolyticum TaxID=69966 RepID=UPI001F20BB78|nr:primosomal protein DnaI [Macrococcus caseolyticus]MCE4956304.1 primosomal protein DnaI [Macrococcus caseolyticus]